MIENFKKTIQGYLLSIKTIKNYKNLYALSTFLFTIFFSIGLPTMYFLQKYYKSIESPTFTVKESFNILIVYYLITFLAFISINILGYVYGKLRCLPVFDMRENVIDKILKNRPGFSNFSMGETINTIREDVINLFWPIDFSLDLFGRLIFFIGAFIMVFRVDKTIALILLLPLISVIFITNKMTTKLRIHSSESRKAASKVSSHLGDIVSNIQSIKVNGVEEEMLNTLINLGEKRRLAQVKTQLTREIMWDMSSLCIGIGTFLVLILSALKLKNGTLSIGDLFIFTFFPRTAFLVHLIGRVTSVSQTAVVSNERIEKLIGIKNAKEIFTKTNINELKDEINPKFNNSISNDNKRKLLKLQNLSSTFNGDHGVKNIDLNIKDGEFLAVTGRIGSGKSTLIRTLVGAKESDFGKIIYEDTDYSEEGLLPPIASYTPQNPNLFSDTIRENILLGKEFNEKYFNKALKDSELLGDLSNLKDGVDTVVGAKGVKLSGGQKQRVAVARMLYHSSDIYLLDDVSSALDVDTESKLWNNLKENNKTRIAVTNRHIALKNADKILVLKDGKVDSYGDLNYLLKNSEEFKKIWGESK